MESIYHKTCPLHLVYFLILEFHNTFQIQLLSCDCQYIDILNGNTWFVLGVLVQELENSCKMQLLLADAEPVHLPTPKHRQNVGKTSYLRCKMKIDSNLLGFSLSS